MNEEKSKSRNRRPRGRSTAKQVGAFLPRVARAAFEAHGFPGAEVLSQWPEIAGADMAAFTAPERLIWPRRRDDGAREDQTAAARSRHRPAGATLVLRVQGPRALEVQHGAPQIIERVNTYFGYRAVAALRIVQGPVARRPKPVPRAAPQENAPDESGLEAIEDDRLRSALARLGAHMD